MPTPNERILAAEIEHALRALGASNRLARGVAIALARFDAETEGMIAAGVAKALRSRSPRASVESLLVAFAALNLKAVEAAFATLLRAMKAFAATEVGYFLRLLGGATGAELVPPATRALADGVSRVLVLGETLTEQEARFAAYRYKQVAEVVRTGVAGGLSTDEIIAQIAGKGGALDKSREALETLARTNTQAAGQIGRNQVYKANPGVVVGQYWSAVLDGRTTPVCRANDGATRTLTAEQVAMWEETGFAEPVGLEEKNPLRKFEETEGPFDAVEWSNGYRGPYPAHYGERSIIVPLVNRAAPDKLTFPEWFEQQPPAVQEKLLGPSRYALWRSGKFSLRDFINDRGRTLTLAELRAQDRAAFDAVTEEAESA